MIKYIKKAEKLIENYYRYKTLYNNCEFKEEIKWDLKVIDCRMYIERLIKEIKEKGCGELVQYKEATHKVSRCGEKKFLCKNCEEIIKKLEEKTA